MGLFEVLTSGNEKKSNTKQNLFESLGLLEEDNNKKNDTKQNLLDFLGMSEEDKVLKEKLEEERLEEERLKKAREEEKNSTLQSITDELEQQVPEKQVKENTKIINKEILEGLNEEERKEYQTLQGIENLAKTLGKEIPKDVKMKLEKYRKNVISIADYRQAWKEKITGIDNDTKEKIIKVADQIPVNIKIERDGSRIVTFEISGKVWKFLLPELNVHSDDKYKRISRYDDSIIPVKSTLGVKGVRGNDVERWKNKKLKEYVKDRQKEGFHIPTRIEMLDFLRKLEKKVGGSDRYEKGLAMLMYLTGMDGRYILSYEKYWDDFTVMIATAKDRKVSYDREEYASVSLLMIACE